MDTRGAGFSYSPPLASKYSLRLRTGPTIFVMVLSQFHSPVSHIEMSESVPPVARKRLNGCSSAEMHEDVCPRNTNSDSASGL